MAKKPKKLLFTLIVIGLLTGGPGCYKSSTSAEEDTGTVTMPDSGGNANSDADADTDSDSDIDTDSDSDIDTDSDTDVDSDSDTDVDSDSDADVDSDSDTDVDSDSDPELCDEYEWEDAYEVPSPPPGVEPDPETLCELDTAFLESNRAATVSLNIYSESLHLAEGQIDLAEGLEDRIVGLPEIEVIQAQPEELIDATTTEVAATSGGFTFNVEFPEADWFGPGYTEITVKVTVEVRCDEDGDTQMVDSTTYLHLCDEQAHPNWVSSGGECAVCEEVFEAAASPLPASRGDSLAALSGSPRVEIVKVAHYGRSLVLFAEHRETEGPLSYDWSVSGGSISENDKSGVIWELPREPGPHLVQVAVRDVSSAAVATLRWRHKA